MPTFKQIEEARKLLGLDEEATLHQIKEAYRKLAFKYHPDKHRGKDRKEHEEMFKKITHARDILLGYCASCRYSFKEKDVKKTTTDKEFYEHLKRFYDGWWGNLDL